MSPLPRAAIYPPAHPLAADSCCAAAPTEISEPALYDAAGKPRYLSRARVIKSLGHPVRLFIVERLALREHCVCELTDMVGVDFSTVSKHLSVLRAAGVVADEKRGSQVWYRLRVPCILNFLGCVEEVLRQ